MHAILVKQGFAINSCISLQRLLRNPAITFLKVVGCEDCVREKKLRLWGSGEETPSPWVIFAIFLGKNNHFNAIWLTFCTFLEQLETAKLLIFKTV